MFQYDVTMGMTRSEVIFPIYLLTFILAYFFDIFIDTSSDAVFLTYLLTYFLFLFWQLRSGAAQSAHGLPGRGPVLPTPLASSPVEARHCPNVPLCWGPALPIAICPSLLRPGTAYCDLSLSVEARHCPLRSISCNWDFALPIVIYNWRNWWRTTRKGRRRRRRRRKKED